MSRAGRSAASEIFSSAGWYKPSTPPLLRLQPGADGFWVGSPATAALMEQEIMSKTNDTSDFGQATLEDHRALADRELDAVSGGWSLSGIPGAGAATTPGHRALTHAV